MTSAQRTRAELIADTAIEVLAGQGMRGLTHRAVDLAAGLPVGSTSNHARTRAALLRTALARISELEASELAATMSFAAGGGDDGTGAGDSALADPATTAAAVPMAAATTDRISDRVAEAVSAPAGSASAAAVLPEFADGIAMVLHRGLTRGRVRLLARYEFALESTRRPDLRAMYDEAGRPFREPAAALLAALGSPAPDRHARMLIAWCEGVQFDSLAGAGTARPPDLAELRADLRQLLRGMIGPSAEA